MFHVSIQEIKTNESAVDSVPVLVDKVSELTRYCGLDLLLLFGIYCYITFYIYCALNVPFQMIILFHPLVIGVVKYDSTFVTLVSVKCCCFEHKQH